LFFFASRAFDNTVGIHQRHTPATTVSTVLSPPSDRGKSNGMMRYINVFIDNNYNILVHKGAPRVARDWVSSCFLWMQLAGTEWATTIKITGWATTITLTEWATTITLTGWATTITLTEWATTITLTGWASTITLTGMGGLPL
jgi:hypothetical protein